jgi:hypothetical protein
MSMPGNPTSQPEAEKGEDPITCPDAARPTVEASKPPENTVSGCQAFADTDLKDAATADTRGDRLELEKSAAGWLKRAGLLQRIANSFKKRDALDQAERERTNATKRLIK